MNITGKTIVFKNTYGYSTTISNKNKEGKYENMYITLQLPKNTELENKTTINITKGFISFYKDKNNLPKIKFVVMEFITEDNSKNENFEENFEENFGKDLPF